MGKGRDNGIRIEGLHKRYGEGDTAVDALKDVNVVVAPGEVVGLIGPSGSGKGTLLKCLVAVIERSGGRMVLGGKTIFEDGCKIPDLRALRRDSIGFVFQAPYLIPFLDVTYNVARLPMLAGRPNGEARARAVELPNALDVGHRAKAWPSEPSGGDQGRSACPGGRPGACGLAVGTCGLDAAAKTLAEAIADKVQALPRGAEVSVYFIFDPPWDRSRISMRSSAATSICSDCMRGRSSVPGS